MAQERSQSRSMVMSQGGIVATSQTLASQAGAAVLARGGNAIDAAIAANATLGVVEPQSCGMGGDLFAIYWDAKTGKLSAINSSGWAPKGLTFEFLNSKGIHDMPQDGIQSVTVPGRPDQPLFIGRHQLPVNRADLALRIDEDERAIQAVASAVGGALNAPQIQGDPIPRRRRAELIEMPSFGLNSLSRVFRKIVFWRAELNRAPSVSSSQNGYPGTSVSPNATRPQPCWAACST